MSTFTIPDVDLELLERQRKALATLTFSDAFKELSQPQREAINGILNMLDEWSDQNYYRNNPDD